MAAPISDTQNTLTASLLIELGVTAAAVLAAIVGGLVAGPARPPAALAVERTAEYIAAGDLSSGSPTRTSAPRWAGWPGRST